MYRIIIIIIQKGFLLKGIFIQINYVLLMILAIYYKPFNVENKTDVAVWLMTMVVVGESGGLAGGLGGGQTVLCRMFSLRFSLLTTALIVYLARYFTFDCCFSTADVMRGGCQLAPQLQPQTQFFCRCYL